MIKTLVEERSDLNNVVIDLLGRTAITPGHRVIGMTETIAGLETVPFGKERIGHGRISHLGIEAMTQVLRMMNAQSLL